MVTTQNSGVINLLDAVRLWFQTSTPDSEEDRVTFSLLRGSRTNRKLDPYEAGGSLSLYVTLLTMTDGYSDSDESDLEITEPSKRSRGRVTGDSASLYVQACHQGGLTPYSSITRQLEDQGLQKLDLTDRALGPRQVKPVTVVLLTVTHVTEIDITNNCIGDQGVTYLLEVLQENVYVSTLKIANNALTITSAKALGRHLSSNGSLQHLDISGNRFKDTEVRYLTDGLKENHGLLQLNMSHNEFRESAGYALGEALAVNDTLEDLDLSWNHFRLKGAIALADGLKVNQVLRVLNVSWNGFSDDGAKAMGNAMKCNKILKELDLSNNRIFMDGLTDLMNGLKRNTSLRVLKLSFNPLTTAGAWFLLSLLRNNPSVAIRYLELKNIPVSYRFLTLKEELRVTRPSFKVIHGEFVRSEDVFAKRWADRDAFHVDPMFLLQMYVRDSGLRMTDLFSQFDHNKDWAITPEEFRKGIRMAGIPFSEAQLDELLAEIDTNDNGEIDYRELMSSHKQYKTKWRKKLTKLSRRTTSFLSRVDVINYSDNPQSGKTVADDQNSAYRLSSMVARSRSPAAPSRPGSSLRPIGESNKEELPDISAPRTFGIRSNPESLLKVKEMGASTSTAAKDLSLPVVSSRPVLDVKHRRQSLKFSNEFRKFVIEAD
ncbi:leucine-rich repeat-containing protein 74A [Lingula anatina]|uniref:Leucine-rich repeat-containing protein 74A n=1 Tax=Lingula anatina TaxID=7574 RepID=A0A1S3HRV2_LINAN|nr:leucine-rich repeat-containing protein 74A [Lingula anatina]|eukprot:XP_013388760.1 leucine-rich repeat-containing protein 74A [Lingula anatina]